MTRDSLISALDRLGVPKSSYGFNQTPDIDLLGQIDGKWSLYVNEKGSTSIIKQFSSEEELYDYYLTSAWKQQEKHDKTQSMTDKDMDDVFAKLEQASSEAEETKEQKKNQGHWRDRLIPWHFADTEFDETIQWAQRQLDHVEKMLESYLDRTKLAQDTDRLRSIAKGAYKSAIVGFLAETHSQNVYQNLGLSAYAAAQLCLTYIDTREGDKYQINWLADGLLEAIRTPIDAQALPSYFEQAMYCAFICRNSKVIGLLAKLPLDVLEQPTHSPTPPHLHLMLSAFQKFWSGDTREALHLSTQAVHSIQEQVNNLNQSNKPLTWRENYYLNITNYNAELFKMAISETTTTTEFNLKLTEAMYAFQKCMKENKNLSDDWNYYFSLGALAWTSLAWDRGLEVEVVSDYIPRFLYQGKFAPRKISPVNSSH